MLHCPLEGRNIKYFWILQIRKILSLEDIGLLCVHFRLNFSLLLWRFTMEISSEADVYSEKLWPCQISAVFVSVVPSSAQLMCVVCRKPLLQKHLALVWVLWEESCTVTGWELWPGPCQVLFCSPHSDELAETKRRCVPLLGSLLSFHARISPLCALLGISRSAVF